MRSGSETGFEPGTASGPGSGCQSVGVTRGARRPIALANIAVTVAIAALYAGCDIPSESPSFTVSPTLKTPLVFSEGLQFLGPGVNGEPSIIDTTSADFDSLFTVSPSDNTIYIFRDVDRIQLDNDVDLFDLTTVGPSSFAARIGEFGVQSFAGSVSRVAGIQDGVSKTTPTLPRVVDDGEIFFPGHIDSVLTDASSDLISLSSSAVLVYGFSPAGPPLNQLTVRMTNRSGQTLTDRSFQTNTRPNVEIVSPTDLVLATAMFDRGPSNNQTAVAQLSLAGLLIPTGSRIRLDVGTTSGTGPIVNNPASLELVASASATRYDSFVLSEIEPQSNILITEDVALAGSQEFDGIEVSSGSIVLTIRNTMALAFDLQSLRLENVDPFGSYSAGHVFASTSGVSIPADGTVTVNLPVGADGIAANTRVVVSLGSPGNPSATSIAATDGLHFDVAATFVVDRVFVAPEGDAYTDTGTFAFDIPEIQLVNGGDFVELTSGTLEISELLNGYGVGLAALQVSFPDIVFPPYGKGDSLVVTVSGIGPLSGPYTRVTDLADARVHAANGEIRYHVRALTQQSAVEGAIGAGDELSGLVTARNLVPRRIAASIDPISVAVTADANGDNLLDVLADNEAQVVSIDGLDEFYDFGLDGLSLIGAELTLDITTDIGADIELVGSLAGVRRSGEIVYLEGLSQNAVDPSDSLSGRFAAGGQPVAPAQLLKMSIIGDGAGKVVSRRIVFNDTNSNVGEFIANLPEEVRMVAQAVIGRENGRVILSDPFVLTIDVALTLPLALSGDVSLSHSLEADLSSLEQLTDPTTSVEIDVAELALEYTNELPIGVDAVFHFLDEFGQETIVLPAVGDPAVRFVAAPSDDDGFAIGSERGRVVFPLNDERLRDLARTRTVSLELRVDTGANNRGRVRATDRVVFAMSGNFDIRIRVGN